MAEINQDHLTEIAVLKREVISLQEELLETNRGVVALYTEIQDANERLQKQQRELEEKNCALEEANHQIAIRERHAAIGQMVITYNHEINNPLFIIHGTLRLLEMSTLQDEEIIREKLAMMIKQCERITKVLERIREFDNLIPKEYINAALLDLNVTSEIPQ